MQFTRPFKEAIRAGDVTATLRKWKSPQARVGGQYNLHPRGAIEVTRIRQLPFGKVTSRAVRQSGYADKESLRSFLKVANEDLVQSEYALPVVQHGLDHRSGFDDRGATGYATDQRLRLPR